MTDLSIRKYIDVLARSGIDSNNNEGEELVINLNDLTLSGHQGFTAKELSKIIESLSSANERAMQEVKKLGIDIAPEPAVKPFKFNPGDKVKVSQTFHTKENNETIDLTGMEGTIISYEGKPWGSQIFYKIDIHGKEFLQPELYLDLIQSPDKPAARYFNQEYEDIDGVILQDQNKGVNMIMEFKR